MAYYRDLREHIKALEERGKLYRITQKVVKETELMPLVRWQFRGLEEKQRGAFLFENVVDIHGKKYDIPVLVASNAASREVYAIGMKCEPDKIMEKWVQAQLNRIKPVLVENACVHEEVHLRDRLLEHGGLEEFPIPISTPGFDNAPYFSSPIWISKDPDTGVPNAGVYRGMIKSPTLVGCLSVSGKHLAIHRKKHKDKGNRYMEVAIVLGAPPNLGYAAVSPVPYGTSEYEIAGGIAGEPMELVKCKTIDLEVPARAEIVIEGVIDTELYEREGPFGEYTGYMGLEKIALFFEVKCITHRKKPIYHAFISQFPPSESSKIRQVSNEAVYFKHLKYDCGISSVLDVAWHESGGSRQYCVVQMKKRHPFQPMQALHAVAALNTSGPKMMIAVDDDIDPRDADSVNWALSFRMQPARDVKIIEHRYVGLDPSGAEPGDPNSMYPLPNGGSSLMIDATRKFKYPPTSLPRQEYMEKAKKMWEEIGLPKLNVKTPWHGRELGYWTDEERKEADLAVQGKHYITGEKLAGQSSDTS